MAGVHPAQSRPRRIVIHAGFAKCGSSSIQGTLFLNLRRLRENGVLLFGENLRVAEDYSSFRTPLWFLEEAKKSGENLAQKLLDEVGFAPGGNDERVGVLSAENLADPKTAELFTGLDQECEVGVVFYWRPQLQWIPSAWQQWGLKKGTPLDEFVSQSISARRPQYRLSIETWKRVLPAARLHVRLLLPRLIEGGNPARDFFHLLGLPADKYEIPNLALNPSLDYSVLHVLSKNPHLFDNAHDNRLIRSLRLVLPQKFQATNIRMLSSDQETRIEESFREENLWLLRTFCRGIDVDQVYGAHFTPRKAEVNYSDVSELDMIYRCLGVILESVASKELSATQGSQPSVVEQNKRRKRGK